MRKESDFLGDVKIPDDALYGVHSYRASVNFPDNTRFSAEWYKAVGVVKKACYETCLSFIDAASEKYPQQLSTLELPDRKILNALIVAAEEVSSGLHFDHFIVPAVSGGAGTSINMNINEIIANRALQITGHKPGEYQYCDPVEHANVFQSTNDVIPTALKVAVIRLLNDLEKSINDLRNAMEQKEKQHLQDLRLGYTQMQQAVPSSYGKLFGAYNDALSRDWWRVSRCVERLKPVNLGGGAIGTGLGIPRFFIMGVVGRLASGTGLPLARSENMTDTTSNLDAFVEVHGIMKAHAVNLEKISSDLRLLSSDVARKILEIPPRQTGSSIMPGKVNPVIPEFVISAAHTVYANDNLISGLSAAGTLELNAYLPVIGHALIGSLRLLAGSCNTLLHNLAEGIVVLGKAAEEDLYRSPSVTTALVPHIGYNKAALLARKMKEEGLSVFEANERLEIMEKGNLEKLMTAENLLALGFTLGQKD